MKLKVKLTSNPAEVNKVDVENSSTLSQALEVLAKLIPGISADAQLSLNKKTPISMDPAATLSSLGVCSGDLVWLLVGPPPSTAPTASQQPPPVSPSAHSDAHKSARNDVHDPQGMDVDKPCTNYGVPPVEASHLSRLLAALPPHPLPSPHKLLLLAVQAAMQEVDFRLAGALPSQQQVPSQQQQQGQQVPFAQPPVLANGVSRLEFVWGASSMSDASLPVGAAEHAGAKCLVTSASMGRFLVVHAKALGKGAALMPQQATPSTGNLRTLHLDTAAIIDTDQLEQQKGGITPGVFKDLRSLWLLLKDELALWALTRSHQVAGLSPPVGLLVLPLELKDKILSILEVRHLSTLACVCMELRQLVDADHLWKPAFLKEFPKASLQERSMAERLGYKHVYVMMWQARKQRQQRAHARSHIRPGFPSPIPGPVFPSRGPTYPPNIIGGDYDRLPGGPSYGGMMPGFGLFGGLQGPPLPGSSHPFAMGGPRLGGGGGGGGGEGGGASLHGPQGLLGPSPFGRRSGGARSEAGHQFWGGG